jgi:hypothetical protein
LGVGHRIGHENLCEVIGTAFAVAGILLSLPQNKK